MLAVAIASLLLSQASEMQASRQAAREESLPLAGGGAALELAPSRDGQLGDLVFRAPLVPGGTDALPAPICINGVCKDPICRYRAKDATATSWPAWGFGETLTKVEGGADTTDEDLPHLGRGEKGRKFNAADYYESATAGACDIGTEDFVIEAVVRTGLDAAGARAFVGKWGGGNGWMVYRSGGLLYSYINQGGLLNLNSTYSASGTLLHVLVGYDRNYASASYGARFAVNGANVANQDASSKAATLTNAEKFTMGATAAGVQTDGAVLYFAIYKQPDWLPGTAANATILDALAADRSARFWGTREEVNGIAPTMTATGPRCAFNAAGKLDCYSASAPILGAVFPPGAGALGGQAIGGGALLVGQLTQPLLYSREFLTGWTLTGTTPVATSGVTSPFVDARATYAITDNDGAGEEYISQTLDITALVTGSDIALCPISAVASSTQVYTVSVTEQTGASCTVTTTHYKPTATTTWQQQEQRHTVLDGDCTQAVITVRPYDVASGAAATGSITALVNTYLGAPYCLPVYVETTASAATASGGALSYATAHSVALGGAQVGDAGNTWTSTRTIAAQTACSARGVNACKAPSGAAVFEIGALQCVYVSNGSPFDCWQSAWVFGGVPYVPGSHSTAAAPFRSVGIIADYATDSYIGWNSWGRKTNAVGLSSPATSAFVIGSAASPATNNPPDGMMIRNVEVYR